MSVQTYWSLYTVTGMWNICKSLVCKMLYNALSIIQAVIFCRLQIIGQSTLILLFDLFVSIYDTTHKHYILFNDI